MSPVASCFECGSVVVPKVLSVVFCGRRPGRDALAGRPGEPPTVLTALHGHDDRVVTASFTADGCFLATGSVDQTVLVWDVSTLKSDERGARHTAWCCRQLCGHTAAACSVSWGLPRPDDGDDEEEYPPRLLLSGSTDKSLRVWAVRAVPDAPGKPRLAPPQPEPEPEPEMAQPEPEPEPDFEPEPEPEPDFEPEPEPEPEAEPALESGRLTVAASLKHLLKISPRQRRVLQATPQVRACLDTLGSDVRRGQTGMLNLPAAGEDDTMRALVWKMVTQTRKARSILKKAEESERRTPLSGLRLSRDPLGIWRCWLPLARKLRRWLVQHSATSGGAPLVVGVGGAAGCGKSTAVDALCLLMDSVMLEDAAQHGEQRWAGRPLRILRTNLDEMVCVEHTWWPTEIRNPHLAGIFGREGRSVLETFSRLLNGGSASDPDLVFVEGWHVGIEHPHYTVVNARLDRLLFTNGPLQAVATQRKERARAEISELQTLKEEFFAERRWVLGDDKLATGRLSWEDSNKLLPFTMVLRVDRAGKILTFSTSVPEQESLQLGVFKATGVGGGLPITFDVTVGLGGEPEERNERRYRGVVEEGYFLTGEVETRREKRVIRRGELDGQFMREVVGGGGSVPSALRICCALSDPRELDAGWRRCGRWRM